MLLELNQHHSGTQLHSGTVFHQNISNQATFYQRVQFRDQDSKRHTSLEKTTTQFGTEALKHKDILAEEAKKSVDISIQELEKCQAFKWLPSAEDAAALSGLVKGYLNVLSSASGGRGRTSSSGPSSPHLTSTPAEEAKTVSREASQCDPLFLRECSTVDSSKVLHVCAPRHVRTLFF